MPDFVTTWAPWMNFLETMHEENDTDTINHKSGDLNY